MADEIISNLEPIEESDLNLKDKFIVGEKKYKTPDMTIAPEEKKDVIQEKEIVPERKEGVVEEDGAYSKILSKIPAQDNQVKSDDVPVDAKEVSDEIDMEGRLNKLVTLAQTKGVFHAVKVAKHMENFYLLDEFHDRLLGEELHNALLEKGLIKET